MAVRCPSCNSSSLLRHKRNFLTRLFHPNSRCYRCLDCGAKSLFNQNDQLIRQVAQK